MLIIRRRAGETLVVGEDVEIELLEIAGNSVKLGIRAPREVLVLRKEMLLTRTENLAASRPAPARRLEAVLDRFRSPETKAKA